MGGEVKRAYQITGRPADEEQVGFLLNGGELELQRRVAGSGTGDWGIRHRSRTPAFQRAEPWTSLEKSDDSTPRGLQIS